MPKQRTLSDNEIALVKAMLRKGWPNDAIHYYFNRPDRLISSGRIAQIKSGTYGAAVEEAVPDDLEAFLTAWDDRKAERPPAPSPVDQRVLRPMFVRANGGWKLADGERERTRIIRESVTPDAVIRNFLLNEKVAEPLQYIQYQAHAQRKWLPVWYYVDQAKSTAAEIADDLRSRVATHPSSRDAVVDRVLKKDTAFRQSTGKAAELRAKLVKGDIANPMTIEQDVVFAYAVQSLPVTSKRKDLETIRKMLLECLDRTEGDPKSGNRRGAIYRAACRLDELLYSNRKS